MPSPLVFTLGFPPRAAVTAFLFVNVPLMLDQSLLALRSHSEGYQTSNSTQVDRFKAAVTVFKGYGGTFPSQAHKSDPKGVQRRAEGPMLVG